MEVNEFETTLYKDDLVIITATGEPLRYTNNDMFLMEKTNICDYIVKLEPGEKFLPCTELQEPYRTELLEQLTPK